MISFYPNHFHWAGHQEFLTPMSREADGFGECLGAGCQMPQGLGKTWQSNAWEPGIFFMNKYQGGVLGDVAFSLRENL